MMITENQKRNYRNKARNALARWWFCMDQCQFCKVNECCAVRIGWLAQAAEWRDDYRHWSTLAR